MGCDIHMYIEFRNTGTPWQADEHHKEVIEDTCISRCEDKKDYCDFCRIGNIKKCDMACKHYNQIYATSRDYILFGLMAGVRKPIKHRKPKGLPKDVSRMIKTASDNYGSDGHSHSYLSLEEFEKILFEEHKGFVGDENGYMPTDKYDIFKQGFEVDIPCFSSIITYGKMLKEKHNVEKYLLDNELVNDVEVRLVFWFDN